MSRIAALSPRISIFELPRLIAVVCLLGACSSEPDGNGDVDSGAVVDTGVVVDTGIVADSGIMIDGGDLDSGAPDSGGPDLDNDGYVDSAAGGDDCDDTDPTINPGAGEACDGIDNDCDPNTNEDGAISVDGVGAYPTLQDAVDAASTGAVITLCDGTFDEQVRVRQSLTIRSRNGAAFTTWTASAGGPALAADDGDVTLEGIMFSGVVGRVVPAPIAMWGGAVALVNADDVVVRDCVFEDNGIAPNPVQQSWGGALGGPEAGTLRIESTTFQRNQATNGGALAHNGALEMSNVQFEENTAVSGGAVAFVGFEAASTATATDTTFVRNRALLGGALLLFAPPNGSVHWRGGELADNLAEDANEVAAGGGIYLEIQETGTATLSDVVIFGNTAERGGGIYIHGFNSEATTVRLERMGFNNNSATTGAGLFVVSTDGTGMVSMGVTKSLQVDAIDVLVASNSAETGGGMTLRTNHGDLIWSGGTFTANDATATGGGIHMSPTSIYSGFSVVGVDVRSNTAPVGAGLHLANPIGLQNFSLSDSSFVSNVAATQGGGVYTQNVTMDAAGLTFEDDVAPSGGAWAARSTRVVLSNSSFIANQGANDAALFLVGEFYEVQATDTTFGTAATANTPFDIATDYGGTATYDVSGTITNLLCAYDNFPSCTF